MTVQQFYFSFIFSVEINNQILTAFKCHFFCHAKTIFLLEKCCVFKVVSFISFLNALICVSKNYSDIEVKPIIEIDSLNFEFFRRVGSIKSSSKDHGFISINVRSYQRSISKSLSKQFL